MVLVVPHSALDLLLYFLIMLTYLFKEKFNQRTSHEEQRWFRNLLCHNAYPAWSLLNVQIS